VPFLLSEHTLEGGDVDEINVTVAVQVRAVTSLLDRYSWSGEAGF
jgi:hypothetical protein